MPTYLATLDSYTQTGSGQVWAAADPTCLWGVDGTTKTLLLVPTSPISVAAGEVVTAVTFTVDLTTTRFNVGVPVAESSIMRMRGGAAIAPVYSPLASLPNGASTRSYIFSGSDLTGADCGAGFGIAIVLSGHTADAATVLRTSVVLVDTSYGGVNPLYGRNLVQPSVMRGRVL